MINLHSNIVEALENILPTYYEMVLHSGIETPCLSYMELNNSIDTTGNTIGYSRITFQIKVWSNRVEELQRYALEVDKTLRALGFKRISSSELYDNRSTMMQKILTFEALALEDYKQ
jgi:predicted transcriptional regulator YheO